jgi:N-methylhydantoinase A
VEWFVGVDVGGTFTDFFATESRSGIIKYFKRPSTPENPGQAIVDGLKEMCDELSINPTDIERLCHGTTVATNSLIQRRGGKVALITTEGFRDLLEIGRQTRPHMYSLQEDQPEPLVPRARRFEVSERVNSNGEIIKHLDEAKLEIVFDAIERCKADSIAVCCLFSFLNKKTEFRIGELLKKRFPDLALSLSSRVRPEFREYERCSTTVLNAYLQPVMGNYLTHLEKELSDYIPDSPIRIYQSSGGLMSIETSKEFPIRTALSGPAAGVVGAVYSAKASSHPNVATLDMGGTSADVALIRNYDAGVRSDRDVAGFPVRLPMVDIHTVGAGGGSIAWLDRDGLMKVGPSSAGANPGPACYGLGGVKPTVTDANLVLGRLSSGGLIGGAMELDIDAARMAIKQLADEIGFTIEKTAQGILGIVIANMVRAVRTISVERGHDPRDYALMPFGGAGPLHGSEVARAMDMKEIIVPVAPGILCAQGLITSDLKEDFVRSGRFDVNNNWPAKIQKIMGLLDQEAQDWFNVEKISAANQQFSVTLDARYVGQNFELQVEFRENDQSTIPIPSKIEQVIQQFNTVHEQFYGFSNQDEQIEVVNIRLTAKGQLDVIAPSPNKENAPINSGPIGSRMVWFDQARPIKTPVYNRAIIEIGTKILGPAIIEQFDSTTVVFPDDKLHIDNALNLIIDINPK